LPQSPLPLVLWSGTISWYKADPKAATPPVGLRYSSALESSSSKVLGAIFFSTRSADQGGAGAGATAAADPEPTTTYSVLRTRLCLQYQACRAGSLEADHLSPGHSVFHLHDPDPEPYLQYDGCLGEDMCL